jgi:hypothetical protein
LKRISGYSGLRNTTRMAHMNLLTRGAQSVKLNQSEYSALLKYKDAKVPREVIDKIISDETMKQSKIIAKLSIVAFMTNDEDLWEKISKKKNEIVARLMSNLDDLKDTITDEQYLALCNLYKMMYGLSC